MKKVPLINTDLIKPFQVDEKEYKKGQIVEASGTFSKHIYYINSGACKQYLIDRRGNQIVFRLIIEEDFCASAYSLLTGKESFDFIECCEDAVIAVYDYQIISFDYDKNIALSNLARQIVEKYFIEEQEKSIALINLTPKERYDNFCLEKANYLQRFNLGDIASYLGVRRETLSRIRSRRF